MKMTKTFILAGILLASTNAQAVAISDMSITLDWNSLAITGPLGSPTTFTEPSTGETFSSDAEGWVGSGNSILDSDYAVNGVSVLASYTDPAVEMSAGYDSGENKGAAAVLVTNSGTGEESGWAGTWGGAIYQANGTGTVVLTLDYSLLGTVSTGVSGEYANGGYELYMDAVDADQWLSTYQTVLTSSGGDIDAAEAAAESAAMLNIFNFSDWQAIECFADPCTLSIDQSDVLSVTFDVVAGKNYFFGAEASVSGYTNISAVPVPAAAWLFGSGLLGLIGVARRKAA